RSALPEVTGVLPVVAEGADQVQATFPVAGVGQPAERRPEVVQLDREATVDEITAEQKLVAEPRGEYTVVTRVGRVHPLHLTAADQPLPGVLAQCLQQPVARGPAAFLDEHQRLVAETSQQGENGGAGCRAPGA